MPRSRCAPCFTTGQRAVTWDYVICYIGQARHHTAAEGTPKDSHVLGIIPLIRLIVVTFHVEGGVEAVESSHNIEHVVYHLNAKVATRVEHGRQGTPTVDKWVVHLCSLETVCTVKTSNLVGYEKYELKSTPVIHNKEQSTIIFEGQLINLSTVFYFITISSMFSHKKYIYTHPSYACNQ